MDSEREVMIDKTLFEQPVDLQKLFEASRLEGGFLTDNIRKRVWPKILAINRYNTVDYRSYLDPKKDFTYIECDIARSLFSYEHLIEWDDAKREKRREALSEIIKCILSKYPQFHYFQGFHDIVSIFLLILEDDHLTFSMVEVVSLYFFSDYMSEDFKIVSRGMNILMLLLEIADPEVHAHLSEAGVEAYFCTAWMLTWFSHDMRQIDEVARVFDALLCSHPLFIIYLCAALVMHHRDEVLACECDFSSLHNLLVHLTKRPTGVPFESMLVLADHWMTVIPPRALKAVIARGDLSDLLVNNKFHLLNKPDIPRYVDADWVLLEAHKLGEVRREHPSPPSLEEQSQLSEKRSEKKRSGWMSKFSSKKSSRPDGVPPISTSPSHKEENSTGHSPSSSPTNSAVAGAESSNASPSPTAAHPTNFSASIYLTSPREDITKVTERGEKSIMSRLRSGAASFFSGRKRASKPGSPDKPAAYVVAQTRAPSVRIEDNSTSERDAGESAATIVDTAEPATEIPTSAQDGTTTATNENGHIDDSAPSPLRTMSRTVSTMRYRRSASGSIDNDETSRPSFRMPRERPSSLYIKEPLNFNPAFDEKDSPAYLWLQKTGYLRYVPSTWMQLQDAVSSNRIGTTLVVVAVAVGVVGIGYQLSTQHTSIQKTSSDIKFNVTMSGFVQTSLRRLDAWLRQNPVLFVLALVLAELVLSVLIIKKVKYTEIDWVAYMQEVSGFLAGERDYTKLRGDTGPLVYPAGFVYIYSGLRHLTDEGLNILRGQYIFMGVYLLNFLLVAAVYLLSDARIPLYTLVLLMLSKRVHSIYMLRMFNDCIAMLFGYAALLLLMRRQYRVGCSVYSLAVSVKMNLLLYAPGVLLVLLLGTGPKETILCLSICAGVQLILGLPFLTTYPVAYLSRSFELGRVFMYKWTVNFKFLPEEVFVGKSLSALLLLLTVIGMAALWAKLLQRANIKSIHQLLTGEGHKLSSHFVAYAILASNFVGVCFARSLHYQFYSWYFHSLPYLLWTATSLPLVARLAVLGAIELAFNVYPATYWSSLVLQMAHLVTLGAMILHPAPRATPVFEQEPSAGDYELIDSDIKEQGIDSPARLRRREFSTTSSPVSTRTMSTRSQNKEVKESPRTRFLRATDSFDLNTSRLQSKEK